MLSSEFVIKPVLHVTARHARCSSVSVYMRLMKTWLECSPASLFTVSMVCEHMLHAIAGYAGCSGVSV